MIRTRTLWPNRVGGLTFWSRDTGYWRRSNSNGGHTWKGEGSTPARRGQDWPVGPGRELRIAWWRVKLARRRSDDRAARSA
jgi:hypothetical protein